jgi:hypothetical protein
MLVNQWIKMNKYKEMSFCPDVVATFDRHDVCSGVEKYPTHSKMVT